MSYQTDMVKVRALLADRLMLRFGVSNPSVGRKVASVADGFQGRTRATLAGLPESSTDMKALSKIPLDGAFMYTFGRFIDEGIPSTARAGTQKMTCLDFVSWMAYKLLNSGYGGTIHVGLVGKQLSTGHVFLVLYKGTANETWVDQWAALQTNVDPIVAAGGEQQNKVAYLDLTPPALHATFDAGKGFSSKTQITHP